jgi:23S rRNA (guanosine2251-2'-O)-methyltransferase
MYMGDTAEIATAYKNAGYTVACAEIRDSVACSDADLKLPVLLIIGGEKRGISSKLSALKDMNIRIPYAREFLGSLSTASAVSILAYEVVRQNPDMKK